MLFECVVAAASPTTEKITIVWWKWLIASPVSEAKLLALTTLNEDSSTTTNPDSQKMTKRLYCIYSHAFTSWFSINKVKDCDIVLVQDLCVND